MLSCRADLQIKLFEVSLSLELVFYSKDLLTLHKQEPSLREDAGPANRQIEAGLHARAINSLGKDYHGDTHLFSYLMVSWLQSISTQQL